MKLNYKEFGEGNQVLIILHGLLGSLDNWQSHAQHFAEDFKVYTIDHRNHGKSPHSEDMDYDLFVDDLAEFFEDQGIQSAHLLGHSMGGKTVMNFATLYPKKVDKMIVADMSPKASDYAHALIFQALNAVDLENLKSRGEAEITISEFIPEFGVRQFLLKNLTRDKEKGFVWKANISAIERNYPHILEGLDEYALFEGETLFLKGAKSNYVTDEDYELINGHFPKAIIQEVSNAGHWLHAENPKEFYEKAIEFLR